MNDAFTRLKKRRRNKSYEKNNVSILYRSGINLYFFI